MNYSTNLSQFERLTSVHISPAACFGFAILILATVLGNTLVLSALFLDKRLHAPSFFLIANMATADLLLGISVLPFSSILEILDDRWIFGQTLCSTWLALDVLCCTASIIALMAVSVDRYIGVTRPLKYGLIMTMRRTIYLIILVWTISILTSVVPLFGLTDRGKMSKGLNITSDRFDTCKVNKNTFYTIFSSMVSFYIPVIILLILYSRVYQEAKRQGEKLENEKRRLYQIDYQIASEQVRQEQNHQTSNGHLKTTIRQSSNDHDHDLLTHDAAAASDEDDHSDQASTSRTSKVKNQRSLLASLKDRSFGRRLFSRMKRNSTLQSLHLPHFHHQSAARDELVVIKRKLRNLKREKKAFHTLVLILGALLICWLPFFVTLPVISILKHVGWIKDENTENTWFKITFWLGYCNSALNPFVYAFSNRAIRRAFRQVICRRFCCFCLRCRKKSEQPVQTRRHRTQSGSLTTETSQIPPRRASSASGDVLRSKTKTEHDPNISAASLFRGANTGAPAVSFTDFLAQTANDNDDDDDDKGLIVVPNLSTTNHSRLVISEV